MRGRRRVVVVVFVLVHLARRLAPVILRGVDIAYHARWRDISESALRNAVEKYPAAGTWAIVMPSVAAAFKTHPLYP